MKKVLFCIDSLGGGGAEKVLVDIIKKIDKSKYDIDVFITFYSGIYIEEIEKYLGKKVKTFIYMNKKNIQNVFYKKYNEIIYKIKYKLAFDYPKMIPALFLKKYDIKIAFLEGRTTNLVSKLGNDGYKIAWVHIDMEKNNIWSKTEQRIIEETYKKFNKIICVSKDVEKKFWNIFPEMKKNTQVIYNLIDKDNIVKKAIHNEKLLQRKKINVISIGRLVEQKGYDILLKAHKKLLDEGIDYNLYILGEGKERKSLEAYINETKIGKNTFLLGFKENRYQYIQEADIFVSSSRYEGYPLAICEAICLHKPIIATNCTGSKEIIENGKYGIGVEVESINSLKEKIKELVLNAEKREKYKKLSKERSKVFEPSSNIKIIERLLDEYTSNRL